MDFPNCLVHNGRKIYPSALILSFNFMFARCPMTDWVEGEDFPDFEKIKSNQSFNWSAFSIPIWARFTNLRVYKSDYGIIGYNVRTIRKTGTLNPKFENDTFKLEHKPIENNYSHCELVQLKAVAKKDKRELRMTFKHNCITPILPLS